MTSILIAIFAALALFAASALLLLLFSGKTSATESRLAALQSRSRAGYDATAPPPSDYQMQDMLALVTRPLAPFRDWLRSNDEQLSYRLSIAGYREPEDADTFLSVKLLAPIVGVLLATFGGAQNFILYAVFLGVVGFFVPD